MPNNNLPAQGERLTEEQVNQVLNAWDFLEFSKAYRGSYYNAYYTPDIVNQQMKNINMNPVDADLSQLEKALSTPKSSEDILRHYAEGIEVKNMFYKRLLRYFSDMASFNLTFDPINVTKDSEFTSPQFKKDLAVLDNFCSKFNFKEEFATVLRQLLRQGVFYCVLREDCGKYTLQELPADFCKITGRFAHGLLFDFDMYWFIGNYGVDIEMYPKVFKKMYNDIYRKISNPYDPSGSVNKRSSTFVYWHQCSPKDGFWAWKISPEVATIVPYFSALFPSLSYDSVLRGLQMDKYFIEASKLLVGIIGFNKEAKSGQVQNQINMTPDMLGKFLGVARQGLSKQIGLVALPMDSIETVEFDSDNNNVITDNTETISKQGLASATALFSDGKLNSHQSKLASAVDSNFINALYPMFADFVEYFVNSQTKKYKFKIRFSDMNIPDDKTERMNKFKTFASMGIVDIQLASRAFDMTPFEFNRSLMLTKTFGFQDKLMSLLSLNNQSGEVGRPAKPDSDNDSTQASIARGSNELKS